MALSPSFVLPLAWLGASTQPPPGGKEVNAPAPVASLRDGGLVIDAGQLSFDGVAVANVQRVPVIARWSSLREVDVVVALDEAELRGQLALADDRVTLMAGVGKSVRLQDTGPWTVRFEGMAWAPVIQGRRWQVRVALPPGLPVRWGWLPTDVAASPMYPWSDAVAGSEEAKRPREEVELRAGETLPCPLVVTPAPGAGSSHVVTDYDRIDVIGLAGARQWAQLRIVAGSFVVEAWARVVRDGPLDCAALVDVAQQRPLRCRTERATGRRTLPAGTQLLAISSPGADASAFAVLRQPSPGFVVAREQRCSRGSSEARSPCEQLDRYIVPIKSGHAEVLLMGSIRADVATMDGDRLEVVDLEVRYCDDGSFATAPALR